MHKALRMPINLLIGGFTKSLTKNASPASRFDYPKEE